MIFALFAFLSALPATAQDLYPHFAALAAAERAGVDYEIVCTPGATASGPLVFSIHGGTMEAGTSELAAAVAHAGAFSHYDFRTSHPQPRARDLHVTSRNFDEPQALAMAASHGPCLSIHGYRARPPHSPDLENACVGGANIALRNAVSEALRATLPADVTIEEPCALFPGLSPQNIVNRCAGGGVQIELTRALRLRLLTDSALRIRIAQALASAVGGPCRASLNFHQ